MKKALILLARPILRLGGVRIDSQLAARKPRLRGARVGDACSRGNVRVRRQVRKEQKISFFTIKDAGIGTSII